MAKIYISVNGKEICCGEVIGVTFKKFLRGSRHFVRKPPCIAFSVESIEKAERLGATEILVVDKEDQVAYKCGIQTLKAKGFKQARGRFEEQWFLPVSVWEVSKYA